MANPEHLEILKQGGFEWTVWRRKNVITPDFISADLRGVDLHGADLAGAILYEADLRGVDLAGARLGRSILRLANLAGANLRGADLAGAIARDADFSDADLSDAILNAAYLGSANFTGADLFGADLRGANLTEANLHNASLLTAYLYNTNFSGANLSGADFNEASVNWTLFSNVDLRGVLGLERVIHGGPSTIGIDTIYKSEGNIPEPFLRGAGVPDTTITYIHSLTREAIQFYSCFISHSSADKEFAQRLHTDLQAKGVRIWFAPHDLPIGARIRPAIDESIRLYDKLLLVLSEASVSSQWVEQEVETALAREREQDGRTVLFPVRIDGAVMESKAGWPAYLRNTRNVGDFTCWKDHDSYRKAFERLLRDLRAQA